MGYFLGNFNEKHIKQRDSTEKFKTTFRMLYRAVVATMTVMEVKFSAKESIKSIALWLITVAILAVIMALVSQAPIPAS